MSNHVDEILNETEDFLSKSGVDLFVAVTSPHDDNPDAMGLWTSDSATKEQICTAIFSVFGHVVGMMSDREKVKAMCDVLHLASESELIHLINKVLSSQGSEVP